MLASPPTLAQTVIAPMTGVIRGTAAAAGRAFTSHLLEDAAKNTAGHATPPRRQGSEGLWRVLPHTASIHPGFSARDVANLAVT